MLEAHLRWIAFPEKRLLLRIAVNALARARRQRDGSGSARTHLAYRMRTPACAGEEQRRLRGNTRMTAQTLHAQLIAALPEHALPKRAKNALLRGGIATLEDAAEWTDRDLLSLPHMGKAYVASLRALTAR
jgi:hypothetical protein